jgi:hypothetical protein
MPVMPVLRCFKPLALEGPTEKLKRQKARKVIKVEVFILDFCFVEVKREAR